MPWTRRRTFRATGLAVVALAVLYAAFGYLVAPYVLRDRMIEMAAQAGLDLRMGAVRTDPFFLTVRLVEPRLASDRANLMLAAPSARARIKWASLWHRTLIVERVSLEEGSLVYAAGGDERIVELGNLVLDATNLDLREGREGRYTASATLGERGKVAAKGTVTLDPLALRGELHVEGAPLSVAWRLLDVAPDPAEGSVDGSLRYAYAAGSGFDLSAVAAQAKLAQGGRLGIEGDVSVQPFGAELQLEASAVPLELARRWIEPQVDAVIAGGRLSASGRLVLGGKAVAHYAGSAALEDVEARSPSGEPLFRWKRLATKEAAVAASPFAVDVGEVVAQAPAANVVISREGQLNLARAFGAKEKAQDAAEEAPLPPISVRRLRVEEGTLSLTDRSMSAPFSTVITGLEGTVTGVGTRSDDPARVRLEGRVGEYGLGRIRGSLDLDDPKSLATLRFTFRNLDLAAFSPYAARFAGYRIESGRLSAELAYRVRDARLVGDNKLVFEKLDLGEKVEQAGAADLPLELAIALLSDSKGRIDIAVPVSGNLNDPQFDIGGLVSQAIRGAVRKVVTAPFRVLARLGGKRGREELDTVAFEPGSPQLTPPEEESIAGVAEALGQRPRLTLRVQGGFDAASDAAALRERLLRRELARRAGYPVETSADPGALPLGEDKVLRAAEAMYRARAGSWLDLVRMRNEKNYPRRLFQALAQTYEVREEDLRALAEARAQTVQAALVERGVPASRIDLRGATPVEPGKEGVPTRLELAARSGPVSAPTRR